VGAVIVLLPTEPAALAAPDGDPADKLHVTLLYLGEEIAPEQIDEIAAMLQAAAVMPPIEALISGAGILGEDAAVVCLLQSQDICDLHDALQAACGQHIAPDTEQFPGYIPHLTIGYPEDVEHGESLLHHALPMVGSEITLNQLAILNGDDRIVVELGGPIAHQDEVESDDVALDDDEDEREYSFGLQRFQTPVATPVAPAVGPPTAGAAPPKPARTVILIGMPVKDPAKVPYKPSGLPFQSPAPYVALLEVKLRQNEVPEQLAQVLAHVHVDPVTTTGKASLTASDTKPPRRALLVEQQPLAAASEAIKAALAVYSVNVDDYPFVIQLGQDLTKADVTALNGQSIDFDNVIAVLEDGRVIYEGNAPAAETEDPGSPAPAEPATTVTPT
jgi:2'-5' RNA ligase